MPDLRKRSFPEPFVKLRRSSGFQWFGLLSRKMPVGVEPAASG
jgi:hypothetical protein